MYKFTGSKEIIERIEHIRALLRQEQPTTELEKTAYERRELRLKDLITNLRRTNGRAMVQMLDDLESECLLTKDGGYRLFGYDLDAIREYDLYLNGGRTHIIESYVFGRDRLIELPLEVAPDEEFRRDAMLRTLVRRWQSDVPIRVLDRPGWRHRGAFYVHVGTEDSLGSSIPPGATTLVEPITEEETLRPNPRSTYLLQFRNGYRCSRCVVTQGRLHIINNERSYRGPEAFLYPGTVRIAGRVRAAALKLPLGDFPALRGVWTYPGTADLILPWEHRSRWRLLATKYRRFVRSREEQQFVQGLLQSKLHPKLSERTRRRYRSDTDSEPHADGLIQMSVEHCVRYSDLLRTGGRGLHDGGRFSLEAMLNATRLSDLLGARAQARIPLPSEVWDARRKELGEYGALFALQFPKPSQWADRVIRLARDTEVPGIEPRMRAGSWVALEELPAEPSIHNDGEKKGWAQPLYALRHGVDTLFGSLIREGNSFTLLVQRNSATQTLRLGEDELKDVRRVCGALIPI